MCARDCFVIAMQHALRFSIIQTTILEIITDIRSRNVSAERNQSDQPSTHFLMDNSLDLRLQNGCFDCCVEREASFRVWPCLRSVCCVIMSHCVTLLIKGIEVSSFASALISLILIYIY